MFGSVILEVFIGLIFLYLLLSLVVTAVQEFVASLLKLRASTLAQGIEALLGDPKNEGLARELAEAIYAHPMILRLYRHKGVPGRGRFGLKGPSYIPNRAFTLALLDTLRRRYAAAPDSIEPIAAEELLAQAPRIVRVMPEGELKAALTMLVGGQDGAASPLATRADQVRRALEGWFDEAMDRVSGWYKRQAQYFTLGIGIVLAVAVNADSIAVAERLWEEQALRDSIVAVAEAAAEDREALGNRTALDLLREAGRFPLGWHAEEGLRPDFTDSSSILPALLGWLMTGFAAGLGAGFWFDLLNRLLRLRASGRVPGTVAKGS